MKFIKRKTQKEYQEYRKAFITEVIIEDKRFGKCVFEKDTKRNSLRLLKGISNMPFDGQAAPQIDINVDENDISLAFQYLGYVYDNRERFLQEFYQGVKDYCDEWEETDSKGAPVAIDLIKTNCEVTNIAVYRSYLGSLIVSLSGSVADDAGRDLLGCHSVKAEINCETGEIEYDLEG